MSIVMAPRVIIVYRHPRFDVIVQQAYKSVGFPEINLASAWEVFRSMSEPIKGLLVSGY